MTLRLVLVSIVACVGLSLPSAERLERWGRSGQAWMHGRLAEWEEGEPLDEGRFVVITDVVDVPSAPVVASSTPEPAPAAAVDVVDIPSLPAAAVSTPETAPVVAAKPVEPVSTVEAAPVVAVKPVEPVSTPEADRAVAVKPVDVEDDAEANAVRADWLAAIEREAAPPVATADDVPPPSPLETIAVVAAFVERAIAAPVVVTEVDGHWWTMWLDDLSGPFPFDRATLDQLAAAQAAVETPAAPKAEPHDEVFSAIVAEMASAFTKDAEALAAKAKSEPAAVPETVAAAPLAAPIVEPAQASAKDSSDASPAPAQTSEGTNAAMKTPASQENRFSHAMRLTREAVNAWANLLHGPALVTLER